VNRKTKWREVGRKFRGHYVSASGRYRYFTRLYEVTEQRGTEWRVRLEESPPVYAHKRPEAAAWIQAAALALNQLDGVTT
jgi:hypothetical protein